MSRAELAAAHGADPRDLELVEHYAQKHDLSVVHRSAAERSIVLRGSLSDLLNAFPARVQMYHHSSGTYRERLGEISIPKELEGVITGIFGFDTRRKHRSPNRSKIISMSGPGGGNGVAATDFAKRYNFPAQFNGQKLDGSGQTIAIIELGGGYRSSDLTAYFQEIGAAVPNVSTISVDHAGNQPSTPDSADGEVMLDIEVAGSVAPGANIAVYFAPNAGQGFLDAITAAVHDTERHPDVISISWASPESSLDQQSITAFHEIFTEAASAGITVCVASGDHGTPDEDAQDWDGTSINVSHPTCDDLVLGCGGTQVDAQGQDVVWNDGTPFDPNSPDGGGWASGGGISQVIAVPAYQANANLPPALANGKPGRGVPDIAMSATNYFSRVDSSEGASGGTSAVAPLMAALVALLNQAKQKNVGFLNPFLYANAATVIHDVTQGTNAITNTAPGYNAGPGWDACTGLGTPDGTAILNAL
jgi:kumamolisin